MKLLVQFGINECKGVGPFNVCRPSITHLPDIYDMMKW